MPISLLPEFDAVPSGSIEHISILGRLSFKVTDETVSQATQWLKAHAQNTAAYVDVQTVSSADDVLSLLNEGAAVAIVSPAQYDELKDSADSSRFAVVGENGTTASVVQYGEKQLAGKLSEPYPTYITYNGKPTYEEIAAATSRGATPIVKAEHLTSNPEENDKLFIGRIITSGLKTDRQDGLYTTLVVDEYGVALGLVYSSKESIHETVKTKTGVYQSRERGLWYKGATSGDTQDVLKIDSDCDGDCLRFVVRQNGTGFCHLKTLTCFGPSKGLPALERILVSRKENAPEGSYTARLFNDEKLLRAKIMEEAEELCTAKTKEEIAFEAADLLYFALTRCVSAGVSLSDVERNLDAKHLKVKRRKGDAKGKWAEKEGIKTEEKPAPGPEPKKEDAPSESDRIQMRRYNASKYSSEEIDDLLRRPAQKNTNILTIVNPIIDAVKTRGDEALIEYAAKFDRCQLKTPVMTAPFPEEAMKIDDATRAAIDLSFENIRKFHSAQGDNERLDVETMPGVICSRFVRPIEAVGCYVPGGSAVLPSTALMLGVPAMVAGCKTIVIASPPRPDGSITPEVVYAAHRVGAKHILLAGGAQAVAALAYGTQSCPKVDKILGPGNQFVTAAKMVVSNDTSAGVSIDMPAGPSEVLVVADDTANPAFVASDLLSQAEHGPDSQVILLTVNLSSEKIQAIEDELHKQAVTLPRSAIVRQSIAHSITLETGSIEEAMRLSNAYAPEHLILHVRDAEKVEQMVENAGSVFVGEWTPESVGDYSAGVNHSLPTYGYAKQYSGVNLASFQKHITSSRLSEEGIRNVGGAVMQLAKVEELEAHRRAVELRLQFLDGKA